mmetsp:Transcript_5085/g.15995  ORF Transcript_5085/g.15995 Transcript_5085/m.15995 type:complete len:239 (+) Transcript_5085:162-878(+)
MGERTKTTRKKTHEADDWRAARRFSAAWAMRARRWPATQAVEQYLKSRRVKGGPRMGLPQWSQAPATRVGALLSFFLRSAASSSAFRRRSSLAAWSALACFCRSRWRFFLSASLARLAARAAASRASGTPALAQSTPSSPTSARPARNASRVLRSAAKKYGTRSRSSVVAGSAPFPSSALTSTELFAAAARCNARRPTTSGASTSRSSGVASNSASAAASSPRSHASNSSLDERDGSG